MGLAAAAVGLWKRCARLDGCPPGSASSSTAASNRLPRTSRNMRLMTNVHFIVCTPSILITYSRFICRCLYANVKDINGLRESKVHQAGRARDISPHLLG